MQAAGWPRGLDVTGGGTGVVSPPGDRRPAGAVRPGRFGPDRVAGAEGSRAADGNRARPPAVRPPPSAYLTNQT